MITCSANIICEIRLMFIVLQLRMQIETNLIFVYQMTVREEKLTLVFCWTVGELSAFLQAVRCKVSSGWCHTHRPAVRVCKQHLSHRINHLLQTSREKLQHLTDCAGCDVNHNKHITVNIHHRLAFDMLWTWCYHTFNHLLSTDVLLISVIV